MNVELLRVVVEREQVQSLATRTSLLTRLKNWNDHESWNSFFTVYWKLIYSTALAAGLTDDEGQEVVQATVISVCKAMPDFKYDRQHGSFKSWLLQLTVWRIKDQLRQRVDDYRSNEVELVPKMAE